jgi:hypothetical protein
MLKETKSLKIAKGLVVLSLDEEGRVVSDKISYILTELKNEPVPRALPILRKFLTLIKQKINTYEGSLEKFDSNADSSSNLISDKISHARGKKINLLLLDSECASETMFTKTLSPVESHDLKNLSHNLNKPNEFYN